MNRKTFLTRSAALAAGTLLGSHVSAKAGTPENAKALAAPDKPEDLFEISLSQWCYHRAIFGNARDDYGWFLKTLRSDPDAVLKGDLDPRDVVVKARELEVSVVDLVNILWFGRGDDAAWLAEFKKRADGEGVRFGVLMCDELGKIGASDPVERRKAVQNHIQWMDTAASLECRFLRVNAYGDGSYLQLCRNAAESLRALGEAAESRGLHVLVENHGHPSSNAAWLAMLLEMAEHPRLGAFTDFDNFFMGGWGHVPERRYDTLQGMLDLAPYTRAVSAKSYDFDSDGNEPKVDFELCLRTALQGGFRGLASAEYEGERLSEDEGTRLTVALLRKARRKLFRETNA
ncbi:sugar phosphate isomerase/epimerase family protein [Pelagicoccus sp. SDUM812005]|uniref:sugar phosphate isomerase/epimerase family protein n=1 Tax=Pelagicoccus sp. SDUM812005 TaxID=3041257 RepID=UPI00280EB232|nr:sugar phosphate isomerase/epimerase family protein [Pelagicoccus sp. SDUM812005]MDQ8183173.1 sugar phosphate isomerase/epimerase [Pelagicoccus sp. SDUM812005]